jgi:hypothetical protein
MFELLMRGGSSFRAPCRWKGKKNMHSKPAILIGHEVDVFDRDESTVVGEKVRTLIDAISSNRELTHVPFEVIAR